MMNLAERTEDDSAERVDLLIIDTNAYGTSIAGFPYFATTFTLRPV